MSTAVRPFASTTICVPPEGSWNRCTVPCTPESSTGLSWALMWVSVRVSPDVLAVATALAATTIKATVASKQHQCLPGHDLPPC
jgi:hypothetical protein